MRSNEGEAVSSIALEERQEVATPQEAVQAASAEIQRMDREFEQEGMEEAEKMIPDTLQALGEEATERFENEVTSINTRMHETAQSAVKEFQGIAEEANTLF